MNFSVGIPIFNEEGNIIDLLSSIKHQKTNDILNKIILYNDGSSDRTAKLIDELILTDSWFKEKIIFIDSKENKGKAFGMNTIFNVSDDDVLVTIDSDMRFVEEDSLNKLLSPFHFDINLGLSNGWYYYEKSDNNIFRVLAISLSVMKELGKNKPFYVSSGAIMALNKKLYKNLRFVIKMTRIDAYTYIYNKHIGLNYFFNDGVTMLDSQDLGRYDISWFVKIQNRSVKFPKIFEETFSNNLLDQEIKLSLADKIKSLAFVLLRHPIKGGIYIIYKLVALLVNSFKANSNYLWRK